MVELPFDNPGTRSTASRDSVSVLLPLPLAGAYDYLVPDDLDLAPGDIVMAPLGKREVMGVVWGPASGEVASAKLRPVAARIDSAPMRDELRRLVDWVAGYTLSPPGAVLRMCFPVPEALEPAAGRKAYRLAGPPPERMTGPRSRVLELMADGLARTASEIAELAGVGAGVANGLASAGSFETVQLAAEAPFAEPRGDHPGPTLSEAQDAAAGALVGQVEAGRFAVTLLEGVTGSGKTEVYFEAIAAALEAGRQVLVMLPEIALTAQWLDRFEARFGAAPAAWHSELTRGERRRVWRGIADGRVRVLVGARSALFLPFRALGLIVVDEEHDAAYKQEDGVAYNARDMAVVRARLNDCPAVLATATPALETLANARSGRYCHLHMPSRHGVAELPDVALVDLRKTPPGRQEWLSPPLVAALEETLAAGEQAMLFLNRRGYAPLTLCGACGHRLECPNCSAWLVEHRLIGRLQCHHCGFSGGLPKQCPECEADESFKACGPGIERLAEEAAARFPEARLAMMASDTLRGPKAVAEMVASVERREIDLLIGTQIVAKGHHFPYLTLVGVVDADLGLKGGDLRAGERTYQLISQVAGRAGRAERPGRVILQTWMPEHPVIAALGAGDPGRFIESEMEGRQAAGMPPFSRLVAIIVSAGEGAAAGGVARDLARKAPREAGCQVFGPAPAPLALLRGRHRFRLLLRAGRDVNVQTVTRRWLSRVQVPANVRLQVDIDPYSFM
ncbi:primosomal protein N' [Oceanibacterium hippocampi]|uniref:Replication restart protein PriA n=1 Tax=Oceanibacterium hippocampi TaxID=745714 RepID=A0A1Y5RDE6_9PROT|nr:primosomal protein N' [Oceanibacterium hippocampi]SLN13619.1 Primosomal protein N' [Oceanibacterium hippocampi]